MSIDHLKLTPANFGAGVCPCGHAHRQSEMGKIDAFKNRTVRSYRWKAPNHCRLPEAICFVPNLLPTFVPLGLEPAVR